MQEALLRAHEALLADDSELSLRAWLYTIVRNGAVSERRKIRPTEQLDENINGVPRPPEIYERNETVRGVVAKLKALPDAQREALVRTELGDQSAEEIASALGTTTGSVGQLVFRARAALRSGVAVVLPMPILRLLLATPAGGEAGATRDRRSARRRPRRWRRRHRRQGWRRDRRRRDRGRAGPGPGRRRRGARRRAPDRRHRRWPGRPRRPRPRGMHTAARDPVSHGSGAAGEGDVGSAAASGETAASTRGGSGGGAQGGESGSTQSFDGGQVSSEPEQGSGGGGSSGRRRRRQARSAASHQRRRPAGSPAADRRSR